MRERLYTQIHKFVISDSQPYNSKKCYLFVMLKIYKKQILQNSLRNNSHKSSQREKLKFVV